MNTKTFNNRIWEQFKEEGSNVVIGYSDDGYYNRYLGDIEPDAETFLKAFLIRALQQQRNKIKQDMEAGLKGMTDSKQIINYINQYLST